MAAVDEFELVGEAVADDGAPAASASRRSGRRATPWVATAVVFVLAGATLATPLRIVLGRGDGPDIGLLELPLSQPPTVAWETAMPYPSVASVQVPGRVIVSTEDDGTSRTVLGLDLETGAEVWRYEDEGYSCQFGQQVVCVTDPGAPDAAVVTIDGHDGTQTTAEHPGAIAAIASESGTLVVESGESSGTEDVVLVAPDGTEQWRAEADVADTESSPAWAFLRIVDDVVVSDYSGTALMLSTGEPAAYPDTVNEDGDWIEETDDGFFLHTDSGDIQIGPSEMMLWFDDDLGGPVVFRQDSSGVITASVRADGTELWRLDDPQCYPWIRVRGVIAIGCWGEDGRESTAALDELTGERRWEAEQADWPMAASNDAVLLSSSARSEIIAIDPASGAELWTVQIPELSYGNYLEIEDGLLVSSDGAVTRLTW